MLAEITQVCGDHDLELVDVLSRDGRGSRFVARVRTQDAVEAILKGCRPERPCERHALAAWQATGASARLLSDLGNGVLLIELLEGEPLGARLAQGKVDFVAIGDMLRRIFHGQRGELRQRYREGQEDQLGALGLVLNAVVLWNTRYMDLALAQLRSRGIEVHEADVARLSPLGFRHINFLGRYAFTLPEPGRLRPLRDPDAVDDEGDEAVA